MNFDDSRYENHKDIITPDGIPILMKDSDYIIIWGYWNGPDEMLVLLLKMEISMKE